MSFLKSLLGNRKHESTPRTDTVPGTVAPDMHSNSNARSLDNDPRSPDMQSKASTSQMDGVARAAKSAIEDQMGVLRFLLQSQQFDQDRLVTYFKIAEQTGMPWTSQDRRDFLRDASVLAPKLLPDGSVENGYDQVRVVLIETHARVVSDGIRSLSKLLQLQALDAAATRTYLAFIEDVARETKSLTRLARQ